MVFANHFFFLDFDQANLNDEQRGGHTPMFASSNWYGLQNRYPMDDLQSLVFSIWYVADIPMSRSSNEQAEGSILLDNLLEGTAKSKMMVCNKNYVM